jgi:hypothetical protein
MKEKGIDVIESRTRGIHERTHIVHKEDEETVHGGLQKLQGPSERRFAELSTRDADTDKSVLRQ